MISDLTSEELKTLAEVVDLYEQIVLKLSNINAFARGVLHIETENEPYYLGWVGYGEHGSLTFQPATDPEEL
ncbi:gp167 [Mycobacterium phage Omega]|uniref:Uncharacterized protein n=1 Tax=Mycobacterium phage Omega TaxID=2907835 RepID=Q853Z9_BPMOM|nr:gp167 [Mycobacterium phage Omega]AAN12809.1 hypothetical protein PBI_OMEGA_167 [Mycobacterium phage Omega]